MDNETSTDNNKDNNPVQQKKSHGCLIATLIIIVIAAIIGIIIYVNREKERTDNPLNKDTPKIYERAAVISDITVTDERLDFSALGETMTFNPNCDIYNLKLTFEFMKNNTSLQTIDKYVGDVKKNNQYTVTISLTDINWEVIKNSFTSNVECRYYVSSGTVKIFS